MAQLGMFVPASGARLVLVSFQPVCWRLRLMRFRCISICPVDTILTRMGAYDNMFSNASTFKVELDEWCGSLIDFRGHWIAAH